MSKPPEKGDEIVLRQTYEATPRPPHYGYDEKGRRLMVTKHIRATVVYVRKRGDFDVETPGSAGAPGSKHRVHPGGSVDYVRGDVCALRYRGAWLHPDQLPQLLEAEAKRHEGHLKGNTRRPSAAK